MDYTLAQVRWWSSAIARQGARRQADAILAGRMVWADTEDVKTVLRALEAI